MKYFKSDADVIKRDEAVMSVLNMTLPFYQMIVERLTEEQFKILFDIATGEISEFSSFTPINDGTTSHRTINILRDRRTNLRDTFRAEIGPKLAKGYNNSLDLLAIAYNELLMNQPNSMDALERSEMLNYHYQVVENYGLNNQVILKK